MSLFSGLTRWRKRRSASDFEFLIAERIGAIHPDFWDVLAASGSVFFSRAYLEMLERNAPENLGLRYVVLSRGARPVAILVLQKLVLKAESILPQGGVGEGWKSRLSRQAKVLVSRPLEDRRVLVLGNMLTFGQHAFVAVADLDPAELWHGAAEALYRVRRAEKLEGSADIQLVKDLVGAGIAQAQSLFEFGYRLAETEPNMVLELDLGWRSYADYLASLASKYRKNVQTRILGHFEEAPYRVEILENPSALAPRLHQLYLAVHEAAELRPFTLPESYWQALPQTFGEKLRVVGIWEADLLIGFVALLLDNDGTVYGYHIGLDRAAAQRVPVYLRLLHAVVAEGIALGGKRISLGRTALEPKAALGAKSEPMAVYARHRQPIWNKLLRGLLSQVGHAEAPERNPFKKAPPPTSTPS